jgi:hypothetical protein
MKNLEKIGTTSAIEGKNWKQELFKFLRNYRVTPHSTTGVPPAETMFNRPVRVKLPSIMDEYTPEMDSIIRKQDIYAKDKMARNRIKRGDTVLVKQRKRNKFTPKYDPRQYTVERVKGSLVTASRDDHTITRNESYFKPYTGTQVYEKPVTATPTPVVPVVQPPQTVPQTQALPQPQSPPQTPPRTPRTVQATPRNTPVPRAIRPPTPKPPVCELSQSETGVMTRSQRQRSQPAWMKDYVVK